MPQTRRHHRIGIRHLIRNLKDHIRSDRRDFVVYSVLRALVLVTLVRSVLIDSWESAALCLASLILFLVPALVETRTGVEIPTMFEALIYLFIFSAEILGEVNHYYVLIPGWDTLLHTLNGFLCGAVGFSLVDLLNRHSDGLRLSPAYLAVVAFCFSMTVGAIWELIEFVVDNTLFLDMQKDFVVDRFASVTLDPTASQRPVMVSGIVRTTAECADGRTFVIDGGYLDLGVVDTMKDLIVNFVGAMAFSVLGYLYASGGISADKVPSRIAHALLLHRRGQRPLVEKGHGQAEGWGVAPEDADAGPGPGD